MFLGDLSYPPNAEAARWLVQDIWPSIAGATLRIVGAGAAPTGPAVVATGFVADLNEEWRRATCMVAPIRSGGGTRVKVLDAFAAGVPVVATGLAVEGLDVVAGTHYLHAETSDQFVEAVNRLLEDTELRARLSNAARVHVVNRFSWQRCWQPLISLIG